MLNVSKTMELIVDFRRTQHPRTYTPLGINGTTAECEAAPLPPQAAEEFLSLPEDPSELLRWCGGEHPDRKHHCLVQQQLLFRIGGLCRG